MDSQQQSGSVTKRARMTVTPEQICAGELCRCEACLAEGPHEPDCPVHAEPPGSCGCDRADQSKGA